MPRQKPKSEYELQRAIWYKKLEEDGFRDIEQDEDNLKVWSSKISRGRRLELGESREAYYHMATRFLNDYQFSSDKEKSIWEYHTNGISARNIALLLQAANIKRSGRMTIWRNINRLSSFMKNMYMSRND